MKKFIIFLIFMPQLFYGQWVQQVSGTNENLNDIFCVTEDLVFAVGDNGTILKTTDGGATWVQKTSGTTQNLRKVQFANASIGYALGNSGILLKSIDGGENWINIITGEIEIFDIATVNNNLIYYSSFGVLKKSVNGGDSFTVVNQLQDIGSLQFISELTGYGSSLGQLFRTTNGGITWNNIGNVDSSFNNSSFYFFSDNIGFVKRNNVLFKTSDSGNNFNFLDNISFHMPKLFASSENEIWGVSVELLLNGQPNYTMKGQLLNNMFFQKIIADEPLLKSISFANTTKGYGVAWLGAIYKNNTGTMLNLKKFKSTIVFKIYPNPSSKNININFNKEILQLYEIQIVDNLGNTVFSKSYSFENDITIDTQNFSKGVYFLTVTSGESKQTEKLIIN